MRKFMNGSPSLLNRISALTVIVHQEQKNVAQPLDCKRSAVPQMRVSVVGRSVRQRGLRSVLVHMSRPMTANRRQQCRQSRCGAAERLLYICGNTCIFQTDRATISLFSLPF